MEYSKKYILIRAIAEGKLKEGRVSNIFRCVIVQTKLQFFILILHYKLLTVDFLFTGSKHFSKIRRIFNIF